MLEHLGRKCALNTASETIITCTCNIYNVGMICRIQTIIFYIAGTDAQKSINFNSLSSPRPLFNVGRPTLSRFMRICIGIQKPTFIGEGGGGGVVYWLKK